MVSVENSGVILRTDLGPSPLKEGSENVPWSAPAGTPILSRIKPHVLPVAVFP